jgi:predicted metal-dependent phosphoesterase TrpH
MEDASGRPGPSPVRLDLHVHTRASRDSVLELSEAVRRARGRGLDGLAITDHNTLVGDEPLRVAAEAVPGFLLVPGVEISTRDGHLLAYGVSELPRSGRSYPETVDAVLRQGGVPVVAHPFRWVHGAGRRGVRCRGIAALETSNGRNARGANLRAQRTRELLGLGGTGGSDAHTPGEVGQAFTLLWPRAPGTAGVLDALRRGECRGEGLGQPWSGRVRVSVQNAVKRLRRGLAPV